MQQNELRVGNWVYEEIGSKNHRVKLYFQIEPTHLLSKKGLQFVYPIPVTKGIFEQMGLSVEQLEGSPYLRITIEGCYGIDKISINTFNGDTFLGWKSWINIPVKIHHIHQFQNLYYGLTGKELEGSPKKQKTPPK